MTHHPRASSTLLTDFLNGLPDAGLRVQVSCPLKPLARVALPPWGARAAVQDPYTWHDIAELVDRAPG